MKYWNGEGQQQELYNLYLKTLVPDCGDADTPEGEALRSIARIGHDIFNNGAGNIFRTWTECDGDDCWDEYELESFWEDRFEAVRRYTGEDVSDLISMCERVAMGYWPERISDVVDSLTNTIIDKIKLSPPPPPRECETKSPSNKYVWIGDQYIPVESLI